MSIVLYRIDDRLIHGQVVVGWGKPLGVGFIVVVDDVLAETAWEQELCRMGVPPHMDVFFVAAADAAYWVKQLATDARPGILITADTATMRQVVERVGAVPGVNVGGIHHRADRTQQLEYVFLTPSEAQDLREIQQHGVEVTAQDVPATRPVPLDKFLSGSLP